MVLSLMRSSDLGFARPATRRGATYEAEEGATVDFNTMMTTVSRLYPEEGKPCSAEATAACTNLVSYLGTTKDKEQRVMDIAARKPGMPRFAPRLSAAAGPASRTTVNSFFSNSHAVRTQAADMECAYTIDAGTVLAVRPNAGDAECDDSRFWLVMLTAPVYYGDSSDPARIRVRYQFLELVASGGSRSDGQRYYIDPSSHSLALSRALTDSSERYVEYTALERSEPQPGDCVRVYSDRGEPVPGSPCTGPIIFFPSTFADELLTIVSAAEDAEKEAAQAADTAEEVALPGDSDE